MYVHMHISMYVHVCSYVTALELWLLQRLLAWLPCWLTNGGPEGSAGMPVPQPTRLDLARLGWLAECTDVWLTTCLGLRWRLTALVALTLHTTNTHANACECAVFTYMYVYWRCVQTANIGAAIWVDVAGS